MDNPLVASEVELGPFVEDREGGLRLYPKVNTLVVDAGSKRGYIPWTLADAVVDDKGPRYVSLELRDINGVLFSHEVSRRHFMLLRAVVLGDR